MKMSNQFRTKGEGSKMNLDYRPLQDGGRHLNWTHMVLPAPRRGCHPLYGKNSSAHLHAQGPPRAPPKFEDNRQDLQDLCELPQRGPRHPF